MTSIHSFTWLGNSKLFPVYPKIIVFNCQKCLCFKSVQTYTFMGGGDLWQKYWFLTLSMCLSFYVAFLAIKKCWCIHFWSGWVWKCVCFVCMWKSWHFGQLLKMINIDIKINNSTKGGGEFVILLCTCQY